MELKRCDVDGTIIGTGGSIRKICEANLVSLQDALLQDADLWKADLRGANLQGADLQGANLYNADLRSANLQGASLRGANLYGADLRYANLRGADLYSADLYGANLQGADLRKVNLQDATLHNANLQGTYLQNAYLYIVAADLEGAILPNFQIVPEVGCFFGFKQVQSCYNCEKQIIELLIPSDAKRTSSLIGRKCRADYVLVNSAWNIDHSPSPEVRFYNRMYRDNKIEYRIGKHVYADSWDDNIRTECTHGIHFYLTFQEAVE